MAMRSDRVFSVVWDGWFNLMDPHRRVQEHVSSFAIHSIHIIIVINLLFYSLYGDKRVDSEGIGTSNVNAASGSKVQTATATSKIKANTGKNWAQAAVVGKPPGHRRNLASKAPSHKIITRR